MEILFEFLGELFFEVLFDIANNKKISKWIRYPIFLFFVCFYGFIVLLFFYLGIKVYQTNLLGSIALIIIGILLAIFFIWGFYKKSRENEHLL